MAIHFLAACGSAGNHELNLSSELGPFLEPSIHADRQNPRDINRRDFILYFNFTIDALLYKKSATCKVGDREPVDCRSGLLPLTNMTDGDHVITVSVIDSLGRKAPDLTTSIRVDTVAPTAQITQRPGNFSGRMTAFTFNGADAQSGLWGLECSLDNTAFVVCTSPLNLTNLANGAHGLRIRARDKANNLSPEAVANWTVNNNAPMINIVNRPPDNTMARAANFTFNGTLDGVAVTQFQCSLNGAAFTDCTSPINYNNLVDGQHSFRVAGRNYNGEYINPTTVTWRVDNIAPNMPVITTNVVAVSPVGTAQFMFTANDGNSGVGSYQCSLDGGAFTGCTSPVSYAGLPEGPHSFAVRAIDRAGNVSVPAVFNWMVDLP